MTKSLYLIDGSGFIFRAYHALPPLTDPRGVPVGAVLGFLNMMIKLMGGMGGQQADPALSTASEASAGGHLKSPDYVAVIFDAARLTFRNRIYPEYKAHRPPAPDDLVPQFALVREAADALNIPRIELADFEADDIIATYAIEARKQGMDVTIVSSDKDLMQCIASGIGMFDPMKQKPIGAPEVMEKFGVAPEKVLDVLALIGDSSDNVPGVPGIGPKTAAELIGQFGDLETLLSRLTEIKQPKRREALIANAEKARLSKELVTLKTDVPLPLPLEQLAFKTPEPEKLFAFVQAHGFKALAARLQQKGRAGTAPLPAPPPQAGEGKRTSSLPEGGRVREGAYTIIRDEKTLSEWIAKARQKGAVAFDTETTGLNAMQAGLVGFSLCVDAGTACYVPLMHKEQGTKDEERVREGDLFSLAPRPSPLAPDQIPLARATQLLKPLLEDESVMKIGHNIKYDMLILKRYGIDIAPIDDSMLISYMLHAGEHGQGMDELAERYLNHTCISYDEVTGSGKSRVCFDEVEIEKAAQYAAEDADITMRLYEFFKPQLVREKLLTLYETIERPLVPVVVRMESAGIKVDLSQLSALSTDFAVRMREYEMEVYTLAGHEFNIASPKQLGEVLFDKLQLPGGSKSVKTGAYSTDSSVLEELAEQGHQLAAKVLEWRQLAKLKSTYSDALAQQIDKDTGRVHTNYALALTTTGRLSSSDPNLQNIPIRTLEGKKIRNAFVAEKGYKLLSADYSQIELRLLAHMADIPTLKTAFQNGDDIHAITASQMFGVPVNAVDSDLRRKAKTINFGIIYGISAHGLAQRLGIGRSEAGTYINQYFEQYPGIRDYMENMKQFAREHGYVTTLFGRRCHVTGIHDKNAARRQFSERAAINAPLQGTAADIIKKAMIAIDKKLSSCGLRSSSTGSTSMARDPAQPNGSQDDGIRMLLQVHDELVFEVQESDIETAQEIIKDGMENAAKLSVPLTVETGVGNHWGEAH